MLSFIQKMSIEHLDVLLTLRGSMCQPLIYASHELIHVMLTMTLGCRDIMDITIPILQEWKLRHKVVQ